MKKKSLAISVVFSFFISGYVISSEIKPESDEDFYKQIEKLKTDYSKAEILSALEGDEEKEETENKFHGTFGTNVEIERTIRDDDVNEGKIKYTLLQGNFYHDDLPGWDFGFYSGREELFSGNLKHAKYDRGVNSIQEIFVNRSYNFSSANIGWGLKLAGESIDERTTPEAKIFGSYQLTESLDVHGYGLYHVEYKRGTGDFPYWEVEPGFGYRISDNSGAWLNFRYQVGQWNAKDGYQETETEWIIKPGVWYNWGKLSASIWGEFGSFEKERNADNAHLWTEDYAKVGLSANYPLSKNWRMFGEVSYKKLDIESGPERDKLDGYIPLFIAGVNYTF